MWQRVGTLRWQWIDEVATGMVDRTSQVPSESRADPREKCKLWRTAIHRSAQPPPDCMYLDILDDYTWEYIAHLAAWAVIQDRRKMGWAAIHQEFALLPRPVHDTVSLHSIESLPQHYVYMYDTQCWIITGCMMIVLVALLIGFLYVIGAMGLVK